MLVLTNHILLYIYLTVKIIICHLRILSKVFISSRYIKEIENHGNVPSLEKLGQLIRALHISADPFFYPAVPSDNLDYQRLLVYLSECSADQITTILALVEAYLRTYKKLD